MKYIVAYDLNRAGQDYAGLRRAIESYPNVHAMQSVYFVNSSRTSAQIFDHLKSFIDDNDLLFVGKVSDWKARGKFTSFLKS